jgi:hypothetical protein
VEEMIAYCGYNCHLCAARSDDPAVRQKLVDSWRKIFGHEHYTAENVRCDGCRADGRLADSSCEARPCAIERGVESCACCDDFVCTKVRKLLASREGMMVYLNTRMADVTEEEYEIAALQFESMPNLVKILMREGKIPQWAGGDGSHDSDDGSDKRRA